MRLSKAVLIAIILLALLGSIDAGYAVYQHYSVDSDAPCNVNELVNCTAVNQSVYSEMWGMPVAGVGLAGYIFFAAICGLMLTGRYLGGWTVWLLLAAALFAFVFSAYLTYIEIFVLGAVCPMCVISMAVVTAIFIIALAGAFNARRRGLRPSALPE
ncbi:vitamin K epoxide reductase family protein [bacterium BMS3Abin01]|nr:vitamin K epoxide reductase family protein [bacterium BMS3Abin01]